VLCGPAWCEEAPFAPGWFVQASGNPEVLKFGGLYQPAPRVQIGAEICYWDGLQVDPADPSLSMEAVARYFALDKQPLNLIVMTVDASAYVGLGLGVCLPMDGRVDDLADIRTGLLFGDGRVQLGIEYSYCMNDLMWAGTANGEHVVLGTMAYRL